MSPSEAPPAVRETPRVKTESNLHERRGKTTRKDGGADWKGSPFHWRRLVKNIGWENQNIGVENQNIGVAKGGKK